jgi:hypothetical protein
MMRQKGHEFDIFVTISVYEIRKVLSILKYIRSISVYNDVPVGRIARVQGGGKKRVWTLLRDGGFPVQKMPVSVVGETGH